MDVRIGVSRVFAGVREALWRARFALLTVGLVYLLAVAIGAVMAQSGNGFALRYRDRLVHQAHSTSPILRALGNDRPVTAAALDCGANLAGGTAEMIAGYWAPAVYPIALYRGWVGGIVSVDGKHRSRIRADSEGFYYLATMLLQLTPYTLLGGAGVNIGLARIRPVGAYAGPKLLTVPRLAWLDALRLWMIAIPLFAVASAFEFLAVPA